MDNIFRLRFIVPARHFPPVELCRGPVQESLPLLLGQGPAGPADDVINAQARGHNGAASRYK